MADGQQVLSGVAALERLRAAEDALESSLLPEGRAHVDRLTGVLALHREYEAEGIALSSVPSVARLLRCSEWRAGRLLDEAMLLTALPGALEALTTGVLTVEQSSVVVTQLRQVTDFQARLALWERLLDRLGRPEGAVLAPARLRELLKGWITRSDPGDAERRRKAAEDERRVEYRDRDDGLVDVLLLGLTRPLAQSALQRIRAKSQPVGLFDDRSADQRRLDAAVDLLLGREDASGPCRGSGQCCSAGGSAGCGCLPGTPVPCGADVKLLVPLGAALGTTDEVATLAGHGPVEPDLLQALLLNRPRLRAVFVDDGGVPVALGAVRAVPERGDPQALRRALLDLAGSPPGRFHPRHPDDHPRPPEHEPRPATPSRAGPRAAEPRDRERPAAEPCAAEPCAAEPCAAEPCAAEPPTAEPRAADASDTGVGGGEPHPPDSPGPYAVTGLLRELVLTRAPLCEFPACGVKAERCDAEHDRAHPAGPTCACNLGPCCRRHHRMKQQGWTKTRLHDSAVRWTGPTGRTWVSPAQHPPPAPAVRPLPPLPTTDALDEVSPTFADDELWELLDRPDDPAAYELRALDREPADTDRTRDQLTTGATRWTLDLDDPWAWNAWPEPLAQV